MSKISDYKNNYNIRQILENKNILNNHINKNNIIDNIFIITINKVSYKILKILRVIPNKRGVFLAVIIDVDSDSGKNSNKVIIKSFLDKNKYYRNYKLYKNGYNLLLENNLLTPIIKQEYIDHKNNIAYIVTEYIENISKLEEQEYLIENYYIKAVSDLHNCGIYQQDLHFNNFIINNNKVFFLDCEGVKKSRCNKILYNNFCDLLSQVNIDLSTKWTDYINLYIKLLNHIDDNHINYNNKLKNILFKKTKKLLKYNIFNFLAKTRRDCSNFKVLYNYNKSYKNCIFNRVFYYNYKELLEDLMSNPEGFIKKHTIKVIKSGSKTHIYLLEYNDFKFVIKKYSKNNMREKNIKNKFNFINNLKHLLIKPRCVKSWENANLLKYLGIGTPEPLGFIKDIKKLLGFDLMQDSYYLMSYCADYMQLADIINNKSSDKYSKFDCINNIRDLLHKFKFLRIAHRDFKSQNVGYSNNALCVLDLDAMNIYSKYNFLYNSFHKKDICRITKCLVSSNYNNISDKNYFISKFTEK